MKIFIPAILLFLLTACNTQYDQGNPKAEQQALTPLLYAVQNNDMQTLQYLLEKGADINLQAGYKTPLTEAVNLGHMPLTDILLKAKADVNMPADFAKPLFYAVKNNDLLITNILLKEGAKPNAYATDKVFCADQAENYCNPPLIEAAKNNSVNLVALLINNGADIDIKNIAGKTALDIAVENNLKETAALLKKAAEKKQIGENICLKHL